MTRGPPSKERKQHRGNILEETSERVPRGGIEKTLQLTNPWASNGGNVFKLERYGNWVRWKLSGGGVSSNGTV